MGVWDREETFLVLAKRPEGCGVAFLRCRNSNRLVGLPEMSSSEVFHMGTNCENSKVWKGFFLLAVHLRYFPQCQLLSCESTGV